MSMCVNTGNVCDHDTYVFASLPSVLLAFFFFFFLNFIWHHERSLGLFTGIADFGAFVVVIVTYYS